MLTAFTSSLAVTARFMPRLLLTVYPPSLKLGQQNLAGTKATLRCVWTPPGVGEAGACLGAALSDSKGGPHTPQGGVVQSQLQVTTGSENNVAKSHLFMGPLWVPPQDLGSHWLLLPAQSPHDSSQPNDSVQLGLLQPTFWRACSALVACKQALRSNVHFIRASFFTINKCLQLDQQPSP